jgi:AbrB family looped-hinge helix DNA binding protein
MLKIKDKKLISLPNQAIATFSEYAIILLVRLIFKERNMNNLATTKLSSKGQVVIPEEIRKNLHLQAGNQFIVMADKDVVILKTITKPSLEQFKILIAKARRQAKRVGLTKQAVREAIREARKK